MDGHSDTNIEFKWCERAQKPYTANDKFIESTDDQFRCIFAKRLNTFFIWPMVC